MENHELQRREAISFLRKLFDSAVDTADPLHVIPKVLPNKPTGRLLIIGAGKASARMAEALETCWLDCEGLVITRYGYARPTKGIQIIEAGHPVPDMAGVNATKTILEKLDMLMKDDHIVALMSGGASALLCAPIDGVSLSEKQAMNAALLASGAPINEINIVRKHLSAVKGGQLAARAYPAKLQAFMISDVPGDDPAVIGSGPTVGENSSVEDALQILRKYGIGIDAHVERALRSSQVVSPDDPRLNNVENLVIAAPSQSLGAAGEAAKAKGIDVICLGDDIEGEAREVAKAHAEFALFEKAKRRAPFVVLSGGELTVTRTGNGIGGPNAEYMLAIAIALQGAKGIYALACDTDGVDGADEVAGAVIAPDTVLRAKQLGLDPQRALENNDAHSFFAKLHDQIVTGPTLTNVNDFRAILVYP